MLHKRSHIPVKTLLSTKVCSTRMQVFNRSYVTSASLVLLSWIRLGHLKWCQTLKLGKYSIIWKVFGSQNPLRIHSKPWENISQTADGNIAHKNNYKLFQNSGICYGLIVDVNSKTKLKAILLSPSYKMFNNSLPFLRCSVILSLAEVEIL